tara:strand:- start:5569 stop:6810 length:1242 start_codon:yes stop_codon:yes gene_type:complete
MVDMGASRAEAPAAPDADLLRSVLLEAGQTAASITLRSIDVGRHGDLRGYRVVAHRTTGVEEVHHLYVEPAGSGDAAPGVVRARASSGESIDVWAYPRDPALPALVAAAHPDGARVLLERLGVRAGTGPLDVHALSYRPHRRAAVRVRTGDATVYLKVVPPDAAHAIADRHRRWRDHGIAVPTALGWSAEGLIALAPLAGSTAAEALPHLDDIESFVQRLDALRARIATTPETRAARRSLAVRADWYRDRLTVRHPECASRLQPLAARIAAAVAVPAQELETIHGDFHLAQVFVQPGIAELAVLDLDTGGIGDPADDDGALWAHLVSTAYRTLADTERRDPALALLAALHPRRTGGQRAVRATAVAATHLLGHALAGSIPVDDALSIAEQLLGAPDEIPLIPLSRSSHALAGT